MVLPGHREHEDLGHRQGRGHRGPSSTCPGSLSRQPIQGDSRRRELRPAAPFQRSLEQPLPPAARRRSQCRAPEPAGRRRVMVCPLAPYRRHERNSPGRRPFGHPDLLANGDSRADLRVHRGCRARVLRPSTREWSGGGAASPVRADASVSPCPLVPERRGDLLAHGRGRDRHRAVQYPSHRRLGHDHRLAVVVRTLHQPAERTLSGVSGGIPRRRVRIVDLLPARMAPPVSPLLPALERQRIPAPQRRHALRADLDRDAQKPRQG